MFDEDRDGKLNKQEFENCMKAIKNGFETNFFWHEAHNNPDYNLRVVQKDGKIYHADGKIHNEDTSYEVSPKHTRTQLIAVRKERAKNEAVEKFTTRYEKMNNSILERYKTHNTE